MGNLIDDASDAVRKFLCDFHGTEFVGGFIGGGYAVFRRETAL